MNLHETIETILPLVSKPSRYLGNEFHAIRKEPSSVAVQWLLVMPEVYEIGMSHWGLKILYDILNRRSDTLAERAYCPWIDMEAEMRLREIPFFSLETHRPARDFDLIGFTLQYEMTCTNILTCLDLARIPLWSRERGEDDPLIIGGGPCVSNPEPLAEFFDLFLLGDGEEAVHKITEMVGRTRGLPRLERLKNFAAMDGIYVPGLYRSRYDDDGRFLGTFPTCEEAPARPRRTFVRDLEATPYPTQPLVPLQEVIQDRLSVEVLRGCTQGCRFCQAGYTYRPLRERSPHRLLEITELGLKSTGWDSVSLVSLSTADYTQLDPLVDALNRRFANEKVSISLPSLRADRFGIEIAERVREVKRSGFTFAPEAGSERLRYAVNKQIRDDELFNAARIAYEQGWRLIKLYMMIGLPTETRQDVEEIASFTKRIREIGREAGPSCKVNLSIGAFVPKSHTPFQWDRFEDLSLLRQKLSFLRERISNRWTRVKWNDLETSQIEAVFSRGDRRLARVVHRAWESGSRFDGWAEHFSYDRWIQALADCGLSVGLFTRPMDFDEPLPWDHIDLGITKKFLIRERKKTNDLHTTPDCRYGDCAACGIPGMPNDTMRAPELDREAREKMLHRASEGAARRSGAGIVWTVRIRYAKEGAARFLSHLEATKVIDHAFRIVGLPVAHSQGHSPHPKYHFGPPLPVGVASRVELFDVEIETPWRHDLAEELNRVLPVGLEIVQVLRLPSAAGRRRKSLSAEAGLARYEVDLHRLEHGRLIQIEEVMAQFRESQEWVVSKGRRSDPDPSRETRKVDLKRACLEIDWDPGLARITMLLRILDSAGQTGNPARILGGLFGLSAEDQARCLVRRVDLLREDQTPIWAEGNMIRE